jgi:hypothetical protein
MLFRKVACGMLPTSICRIWRVWPRSSCRWRMRPGDFVRPADGDEAVDGDGDVGCFGGVADLALAFL